MQGDYDFDEAFRRIQEVLLVGTQRQIGEALGLSQASICAARVRRAVPARWLLTLYEEKGLNPLWVLYGDEHKKYLQPTDEVPDAGSSEWPTVVPAEAIPGPTVSLSEVS